MDKEEGGSERREGSTISSVQITPFLAPCYSEGSIVPEYDMLNGAMFIAVRGERAQISLTHSAVSCYTVR